MNNSLRAGITFGMTSAVITTLGLMVGLHAGTHSKVVVLAGIMTIAIADAFSDALGIHISKEAESTYTPGQVWGATAATFAAKLLFASTFIVPVLLFHDLFMAVVVSLIWGLSILTALSYYIARLQNESPWKIIGEHLVIAVIVLAMTHWIGVFIEKMCV